MDLKKTIKYVLCGIQNTNYPIGYKEMDEVSKQYLELLHLKKEIHPSDFIGPNSYTLQLKNVINFEEELTTPSILKNYTVTDKADGERHLLYINGDGLIFLIDTNIIYFKLDHSKIDSVTLINSMLKKNIKFFELGPNWFRLVTHAGIDEEDIDHVLIQFKDLFSKI